VVEPDTGFSVERIGTIYRKNGPALIAENGGNGRCANLVLGSFSFREKLKMKKVS
jgi:hypothetical protein